MILHQLVHGPSSASFDDGPIVGAAGTTAISSMVVRSGEVLDGLQVTSSGTSSGWDQPVDYALPPHGGNGGRADTIVIAQGDSVASVSGYTGNWYGWQCVLQLTVTTRQGQVFGPYGTMGGATSPTPFSFTAPAGQSILSFSGTTETVPLADGSTTSIVASLAAHFG